MGIQVVNRLDAEAALHVAQLLVLAGDEQEIVSTLASFLDDQVHLHLVHLDWSDNGADLALTLVAQYPAGQGYHGSPRLCFARESQVILDWLAVSILSLEPVWFRDTARLVPSKAPDILGGTYPTIIMRLTGRARVVQAESHPHALLCFCWSEAHPFTSEERRFFTSLSEVLSATVSGCRLRTEALEYVHQLQELDRLRTTFLASVSHDMRTPLNQIMALSTGILGDDFALDEATRVDIEAICQAAEYLSAMISEMLDYAKLEAAPSSVILDIQAIDVNRLIAEAVAIIQRTRPNSRVQVVYTVSSSPVVVQADPQRVRQVLLNLLTNALKFTPRGQVEVTIHSRNGQAAICVRDTGIGIAPENLTVIFDPFRQLNQLSAKNGIGLGLTICRRLITLMNGRIWVESKVSEGSQFFFSLPLGG